VFIPVGNGYSAILVLQIAGSNLKLSNSLVFNQTGGLVIQNGQLQKSTAVTPVPAPVPAEEKKTHPHPPHFGVDISNNIYNINDTINLTEKNPVSDYYKWFWFMQSTQQPYSQDYILKTQLVPPVGCPNCVCNCGTDMSGNNCKSCGGTKGGVDVGQPSSIQDEHPLLNAIGTAGNTLLNDAGSVGNKAIDVIGNVGNTLLNATGNVGNTLLTDTGKVGNTLLNNNANVGKPTISPSYGYQTSGYASQQSNYGATSGTDPVLNRGSLQRNSYYGSSAPVQSTPMNQFGGQSNQSTTFLPITNDFSKFSK
jgi:hypothetical protein